MTGVKATLIEMIKELPDDVVEKLDEILRFYLAEILEEKSWEELYKEAEKVGWFDLMVSSVKKQVERGDISDLTELFD